MCVYSYKYLENKTDPKSLHSLYLGKSQLSAWEQGQLKNIKVKTSDFSQDTMKKMKRQPTERDKIFVSHASDNRFVSRLHRDLFTSQQ